MAENEPCDVTLVDMYRDLMMVGERLKNEVEAAIKREVAEKAKRAEQGESSESDESEEDYEEEEEDEEGGSEEDDEENDVDDSKHEVPPKNKEKKQRKPRTDLESLLEALHLHKQQKQNLMIKKAILLKFEEALFGNNNITMPIDLRQMGEEEKDGKLEEILQCKDLTKYMPKSLTGNGNSLEYAEKAALRETVTLAKAPPDILKPFRPKTPKKIAVNLIKQQYNIRWNTRSGESKPFDFFELPKQFMKGIVRKTYMQTVLFEHKADIIDLGHRMASSGGAIEKKVFCPPYVYVKKDPYRKDNQDESLPVRARDEPKFSWQRWDIQSGDCEEMGFDFPPELKWIDPKVKILIKKLTQPMPDNFHPERLENLMYLLVVNETTSKMLSEIGNSSQIYIGGADEGLKAKVLDNEDSHCARVKELYEHFSTMESFVPNTTALLVEIRMLLAYARREPFAVFALKAFDEPRALGRELHDLIIQALYLANNEIWGPAVNMKFGLNLKEELKKRRRFLPDHFPGQNRRKKK